jgi:hypothetical protein
MLHSIDSILLSGARKFRAPLIHQQLTALPFAAGPFCFAPKFSLARPCELIHTNIMNSSLRATSLPSYHAAKTTAVLHKPAMEK